MQLNEVPSHATYSIRAYTQNSVTINTEVYTHSLIIMSHQLITPWRPQTLADLIPSDWDALFNLNPELILLGTGPSFGHPSPEQIKPLTQAKIGIEFMATDAACRTFVALASEGRKVAGCFIIGQSI